MTIQNVTLIGATGNLGVPLLAALKKHFRIQVVTRQSSKSTVADDSSIKVVRISDDFPVGELETIFQGQDAVVCASSAYSGPIQFNIIDAAHKAGVKRFIPSEFGFDTRDPEMLDILPALSEKSKVHRHFQAITDSDPEGTFSWTVIMTGLFFDWALHNNFLHFDLKERRASLFGEGTQRFSTSTVGTISDAVVQVLLREDETRNKFLYIQSFSVTQKEVLDALQKATSEPWKVEHLDNAQYLADNRKLMMDGDVPGLLNTIYALGVSRTRFEGLDGFANELLGLQTLDVDTEVAKVVQEFKAEK